jgi:hypothetical protein
MAIHDTKFRTKPIRVDAVQWKGNNFTEVGPVLDCEEVKRWFIDGRTKNLVMDLAELSDELEAEIDSWIVRTEKEHLFSVYSAEEFEKRHEKVLRDHGRKKKREKQMNIQDYWTNN